MKLSEETKRKISETRKARNIPAWNKGIKHSKETLKKISDALKDRYSDKTKHGRYGKGFSEESKQKMRDSMKKTIAKRPDWRDGKNNPFFGKKHSEETRRKIGLSILGEKNRNWKGGITPIINKIRNLPETRAWRDVVFKRDRYICQLCLKSKSGHLNAHHIFSFSTAQKKRLDANNGITLCEECHKWLHSGKIRAGRIKRLGLTPLSKEGLGVVTVTA